jgi:hypothetical protein
MWTCFVAFAGCDREMSGQPFVLLLSWIERVVPLAESVTRNCGAPAPLALTDPLAR